MIIKRYPMGTYGLNYQPNFILQLHKVAKFLHADAEGLWFLVDPRSSTEEREFYFRLSDQFEPSPEYGMVTADMTYLTSFEIANDIPGKRWFLFWNR